MVRKVSIPVGGCLAVFLVAASHGARAQQSTHESAAKVVEYLLLGDATRGAGEPMVAVDPTNPRNIIAVAMGDLHRPDDSPVTHGMTDAYHALPNSTITWLGVTHDGGRTWKVGELPILDHKQFTRCPDSFITVSPDGTFYAGCEPRETAGDFFGGSYMVVSKDKGDTWGAPVPMITSYDKPRFAPGLKPRIGGNSPWDRPFLKVDPSTGTVFAQAGGGETDADQKPGVYRTQAYITASTDGGRSFGTIYSWDSPEYPELGRGDFAVSHGTLLVVYLARSAPATGGATCPCTVMGLSRDLGKTFQYHVLPDVPAQRAPGPPPTGVRPLVGGKPAPFPGAGGPGGLKLVADQSKPGHFALMVVHEDRLEVSVSTDFGATWSGWRPAGSVPETKIAKPWMDFSSTGALALMWRAIHADGSYEIYSTASSDGGSTFSQPLRVSRSPSPYRIDERAGGWFGDDIQDLVVDRDEVYMVWGDSRSGFLGTWFSRVPLAAYDLPH